MVSLPHMFELYRGALKGELCYSWKTEIESYLLWLHEQIEQAESQNEKRLLGEQIEFTLEIWDLVKKIIGGKTYV